MMQKTTIAIMIFSAISYAKPIDKHNETTVYDDGSIECFLKLLK